MKKAIFLGLLFVLIVPFTSHAALDANLKYGMKGDSVTELQEFLTDQGVYSGPVTGNFYSLTLAAVKAFQAKQNVSPISGYWGPLSRAKAQSLLDLNISDNEEKVETGTVTPIIAPVITPVTGSILPDQNPQTINVSPTQQGDFLTIDIVRSPATLKVGENPSPFFSYQLADPVTLLGTQVKINFDGNIIYSNTLTDSMIKGSSNGIQGAGQVFGSNYNTDNNATFQYWSNIGITGSEGSHTITISAGKQSASFQFILN